MATTKAEYFEEIQRICTDDNHEQIFKYIFDFLNKDEISEFVEFVKLEKGIETNNDNDEEEE